MLNTSTHSKNSFRFTRLALFAGTLASFWQGGAMVAKADIIGADNRITPSYQWLVDNGRKPIGRLEVQAADGKYYTCSFTVVGRNIGLTNTHCLRDAQGRGPKQIKAYAVQHGSKTYASANVDAYWTGLSKSPSTVGESVRDWAIVRFTSNLGSTTGWFGNVAYNGSIVNAGNTVVGQTTNLIGYSGGGKTPTGHFNCNLGQVTSGVVMHACDSLRGSSGSSLHNSSRQIQALHWGSFLHGSTRINGSVPLERFMPAILQLRKDSSVNSRVPAP